MIWDGMGQNRRGEDVVGEDDMGWDGMGQRRRGEDVVGEDDMGWDGMGQNRRGEDVVGEDSRGCGRIRYKRIFRVEIDESVQKMIRRRLDKII